jgi:hypothetical protein
LGGYYAPFYIDESAKVIASDGAAAPSLGTTFDSSVFQLAFPGAALELATNNVLTTSDGTVDAYAIPSADFANVFYQGPAGTLDYLVYGAGTPDVSYVPIFDIPAAGDTAAAINPADLVGLGDSGSLTTLLTDIQSLF